jgi:hypothetical protein
MRLWGVIITPHSPYVKSIPFGLSKLYHKEICVHSLYVYVCRFHTKQFRQDFAWFLAPTTEQMQRQTGKRKGKKSSSKNKKDRKKQQNQKRFPLTHQIKAT